MPKEDAKGKKKKGLSLEEKRAKILQVYYEKREPLNLKEIEKWGAKKGVVLQTIKDVNQSLIDDNLVCTDKIGIGAFFWALPSQGFQVRKNQLVEYEEKIQKCKAETQQAQVNAERSREARAQTADGSGEMAPTREQMLFEIAEATKLQETLQSELQQYKRSDPEVVARISQDTMTAKTAINRWTDNLYLIVQWIQQSRPGVSSGELEKNFTILRGLDYIE